MTDSRALYASQAKVLFEKNLRSFEQYNFEIYKILVTHQPKSTLVFDADGTPDIVCDGSREFSGRAAAIAAEKIEKFDEFPTHLAIAKPEPGLLDRYGNLLLKNILDQAKSENIQFTNGLPKADAFFLLSFGIGLGHHIDALIRKTSPVFVIFIDPNIDHLYHSLHVYPWHELLSQQARIGGAVIINFDHDPYIVTAQIQKVIRNYCPSGLDGTPCFVYSDMENSKPAIENIQRNAGTILAGLGFLFDNALMLKNSYLNLREGPNNFFQRAETADIETPVFIIGAGASLDSDIEFLRTHANKAIIISTGSAIRSLLVNGITPDFHIELENIHVYSSILELSGSFDLSSICLVVPTAIEHHITPFFADILYYYRDTTPAFPLFGNMTKNSLSMPDPLVVNASFSFAIDLGAKHIFLFGTDFGSRGNGLDHAKDNVLFTDTAIVGYVREFGHPVAANFSGQFYASDDFLWGLKVIRETILMLGKGRNFYNCSDGAKIDGAIPVKSNTLQLNAFPHLKKRDLNRIRKRHKVMTRTRFEKCWDEEKLRSEINDIADKLVALLGQADAFKNNEYLIRYMQIADRFQSLSRPLPITDNPDHKKTVAMLFRGTIDLCLLCTRYYFTRVEDPEARNRLYHIVAKEFVTAIEQMRLDALAVIDNPAEILPAKAGGKWDKDDFIQEAHYTWGDTHRNAPCPCGSGKRFKHCHGKKT